MPKLPLYDGTVGTDAKFSRTNSARFLQDYEIYMFVACESLMSKERPFFQLTVSELLQPYVQWYLSQVFIGISSDVPDSGILTVLVKHEVTMTCAIHRRLTGSLKM